MKKKIICFMLCSILIIMTGCYYVEYESSAKYNIQKGKTITNTYSYDVKENFEGMKLKIKLVIEEGRVEYELKDPNGEIRWSNGVDGKNTFEETKEFEKIVGNWTLEFYSIDNAAEGKLNLKFSKL